MVLYLLKIFFFLLALVATIPVSSETESSPDDQKYAKDNGAARPILSYIFGSAGCLVILGVIYFAWAKHHRGERVCPGVKRKTKTNALQRGAVESQRMPERTSYGRQRTVISMYGAANPYSWPGQQTSPKHRNEGYRLQDRSQTLPQHPQNDRSHQPHNIRKPAPVARPGTPIPANYASRDGIYGVSAHGSRAPAYSHRYQ